MRLWVGVTRVWWGYGWGLGWQLVVEGEVVVLAVGLENRVVIGGMDRGWGRRWWLKGKDWRGVGGCVCG